jgi:hypothetical protein
MLHVWQVYQVKDCPHTTPVKDKYCIIVCFDNEPLGFLINSSIGNFIKKRPVFLKHQIPITSAECSFLHHDSYIDCSCIYSFDDSLTYSGRGNINASIQQQIKQIVTNSPLISKYHQNLINSS